jgi:hypothetical protein
MSVASCVAPPFNFQPFWVEIFMPFFVSLQCVLNFGWANPIRSRSDYLSSTPECSSILSSSSCIFSCAGNNCKAQRVTATYHSEVHCSAAVCNIDNCRTRGPPKYTAEVVTTRPTHTCHSVPAFRSQNVHRCLLGNTEAWPRHSSSG